MSTMVWDETGARYYETGVSKGILWTPKILARDEPIGVPWNGLVAVNLNPQGGELESYYFDGAKYMNRILATDFQAEIQTITTPKEFGVCEGDRAFAPGVMTSFGKRDKFHMAWRTEIGNDQGEAIGHKVHIAYNNLVQPSGRNYQTIADSTSMDTRTLTITATPACGRHSYFWFDSRYYDLSLLEAQLATGVMPMCFELRDLVSAYVEDEDPEDPDYGCAVLVETLEDYIHGQLVDDTVDGVSEDHITHNVVYGLINDGLDVVDLPAEGDFTANDSAASEVGTGSLTDDDDATYITSADGDLGWTVGLPPLVGYVEGSSFELHVRMSITGGVNPDDPDNLDADAQIHISTDVFGDETIGGFSDGTDEGMGFSLEYVDGTIVDYTIPLDMDPWVDTDINDVVEALEAGAYLNVVGVSNNNPDPDDTPIEVNVYEMYVEMLNDTDPDKWLRAPDVDDTAAVSNIELTIEDPDNPGDPLVNSASYYVDFKTFVAHVDTSDYVPAQAVMGWNGLGAADDPYGPGSFYVRYPFAVPTFYWNNGLSEADEVGNVVLDIDTWYQLRVDWSYGPIRARLYKRDNLNLAVFDESFDTGDLNPVGYMQAHAGFITDGDDAAEVGVDNAKIQVHCRDVAPPGPPIEIDVPLTQALIVSTNSDGTTNNDFVDFPGDWPVTMKIQRYSNPTYTHFQGTFLYPAYWDGEEASSGAFIPDTPAGYELTEVRFLIKAHMTGGDPDDIPDDTSSWGTLPQLERSPWLGDVHGGITRVFDDFPTSAPADWIISEPFSPLDDHYQSEWAMEHALSLLPSTPYPAEARQIVISDMAMRFIYNSI